MVSYIIIIGEAIAELKKLPAKSVDCIVTSPPYFGLRDYGHEDQIGLEKTPFQYIRMILALFKEMHKALKDQGTIWWNIGDSYMFDSAYKNMKYKMSTQNLLGIPWMTAFAVQGRILTPFEMFGDISEDMKVAIKSKDWKAMKSIRNRIREYDLLSKEIKAGNRFVLRQDIIWHKHKVMPESVRNRCTKSHEYIFMFSKDNKAPVIYNSNDTNEWSLSPNMEETIEKPCEEGMKDVKRWRGCMYYFDYLAIREKSKLKWNSAINFGLGDRSKYNGSAFSETKGLDSFHEDKVRNYRNKRDVWTVNTCASAKDSHLAPYPKKLIRPCILAGCPKGGTVLDPFSGSGTTGEVAMSLDRNYIGIELNPEFAEHSIKKLDVILSQTKQTGLM